MATKGLAKLKSEMLFNSDLTRLVDVMKGIAASQYYIMEKKKTHLERFNEELDGFFQMYDFRHSSHPFVAMSNKKRLIGIVATDSGFLGGLNMKVAQAAFRHETRDTQFFVLGERGVSYLKEFEKPYKAFAGVSPDETRFKLVDRMTSYILQEVLKDHYGHVILVYPHAINFSSQRVEAVNLIPCPIFFKNKPDTVPTAEEQSKQIILESSQDGIIEYLTAVWMRKRLLELLEDSKSAEYGARTMHLEGSYQTLTKIDKQLKLQFFKARREKIDQSLRETFTSQLMCGK